MRLSLSLLLSYIRALKVWSLGLQSTSFQSSFLLTSARRQDPTTADSPSSLGQLLCANELNLAGIMASAAELKDLRSCSIQFREILLELHLSLGDPAPPKRRTIPHSKGLPKGHPSCHLQMVLKNLRLMLLPPPSHATTVSGRQTSSWCHCLL